MNKLIKHAVAGITALALVAGPVMAASTSSRIGYASETVMPDNGETVVATTLLLAAAVFLTVAIVASEDESESN
jgi:hypothetical protein